MISDDSTHHCNMCGLLLDASRTSEDHRGLNFGLCDGCRQWFTLRHAVIAGERLPRIAVEPLEPSAGTPETALGDDATDDDERSDWESIAHDLASVLCSDDVYPCAKHHGGTEALQTFVDASGIALRL
jgi:hypothetical protein